MNTARVVDKLNDILRWEWKGVVQYTQASFLVQDVWREVYESLFRKGADESLEHARLIGNKIVALGGMPTTEHAEVHQSTDLQEMLHQALEVEQGAVAHYSEALELCQDDAPLRVLLENIILEEQEGAEHLEKLLKAGELVAREGRKFTKLVAFETKVVVIRAGAALSTGGSGNAAGQAATISLIAAVPAMLVSRACGSTSSPARTLSRVIESHESGVLR